MILRRRRSLDNTGPLYMEINRNDEDNSFCFFPGGSFPKSLTSFRQYSYLSMKQAVLTIALVIILAFVGVCGTQLFQGKVIPQMKLPQQSRHSRDYHYWSAEEIHTTLLEWNDTMYPSFVHVTSSQTEYNLPAPGSEHDCPFDATMKGCQTWILSIQTPSIQSTLAASRKRRRKSKPQVFLSGALHGDERIGPTVVMETASLLLQVAKTADVCTAANTYHQCQSFERNLELEWGISNTQRQWLIRLVTTRHILIIPTANALGYFRKAREEDMVDPNRDFPYDAEDTQMCLQSVAARSIVSMLQDELIQLGVTFHGGTEAITYEWGSFSHLLDEAAPDAVSQRQMSQAYQQFSSAALSSEDPQLQYYPVGTMNNLVYPVHGGMEDWAYAASWDKAGTTTSDCSIEDWNATRTDDNDASFRIFTALVETSNDKKPALHTLGASNQLLVQGGIGYINRNMRLSLAMLDLVEPYVVMESLDQNDDDFTAMLQYDIASENTNNIITVPLQQESITISWRVGGSVTVDETWLIYGTESELGHALWSYSSADPMQRPPSTILSHTQETNAFTISTPQGGTTRWHPNGETTFRATLDLPSESSTKAPIRVFAVARVDANWSGGQTHVARVRTDPRWFYEKVESGAMVQGQLEWFSTPLTIVTVSAAGATKKKKATAINIDWMQNGSFSSMTVFCVAAFVLVTLCLLLARCKGCVGIQMHRRALISTDEEKA